MPSTPQDEARAALTAAGQLPDTEIDLASVALQFARIDAPEADWRGAAAALSTLAREAVAAATADPVADEGDPDRRRAVLAELIHGRGGFAGDSQTYDDLANANLIRVLERKRGLPVALGILWLHAAEAAGWGAHGVDFPGHFLVALEGQRGQSLVDVFAGGTAMAAPALRAMLKRMEGEKAELRPGLLRPMARREVLLRLQNNIKARAWRGGDVERAAETLRRMLLVAPNFAPAWRELGVVEGQLGRIRQAMAATERFLMLAGDEAASLEAEAFLRHIRLQLN